MDKDIPTPPSFYSFRQVSAITELPESTIRFYCERFSYFLDVEKVGSHVRFYEDDIETLKYIKKLLKVDNLTIEQALDHLNELTKPIEYPKENREETTSDIKIIIAKIMEEFSNKLELTRVDILKNIDSNFKILNEKTKKQHTEMLNETKEHIDLLRQEIKLEREKNVQLTDLILKLYNQPSNVEIPSKKQPIIPKKKAMKKNIFDMF